jgi:hypothetical protein
MKKILLILLIIIALPLYTYNALLLCKVKLPGQKNNRHDVLVKSRHTFELLLVGAAPAKFEIKGRDPFTLYKERPKPPVKTEALAHPTVKNEITPPPVTISGILWNPSNPVAMVKLSGGSTKLVKAGQELDKNMHVKNVGKRNITVVCGGKEFVIEKR